MTVDPGRLGWILAQIETITFNWINQRYQALRYGDAITDVWSENLGEVEAAVTRIGLANHVGALRSG